MSTSRSSSIPLQRGQACAYCRRRKMRCDGVKPICGQCRRANREEDCEYTDQFSRSRAEVLEEDISRLEARIIELEHPQDAGAPVYLHYPYPFQETEVGWWSTDEPTPHIIRRLVEIFGVHRHDLGFFLDPALFRESALPLGHHSRPTPALLNAVYLWGLHLSGDPTLVTHEHVFLARAIDLAPKALSTNHPARVLHTIQAEILLSYYFFSEGRFLEGKYRVASAVSMCIAGGLHNIRVPVQDDERVLAFWNTVILDQTWAVALSSVPNFLTSTININTPFPDHGQPAGSGGGTNSSITLLAQAAIIWSRIAAFVKSSTFDANAFTLLDLHLDNLLQKFPPLLDIVDFNVRRRLVVAQGIVFTARISLCKRSNERQKVLDAVTAIMQLTQTLQTCFPPNATTMFVDPIIGTCWTLASNVVVDEMGSNCNENLTSILERAISNMATPAQTGALMRYQCSAIVDAFNNVRRS